MRFKRIISYPLGYVIGYSPVWYMMALDYRHNIVMKKYELQNILRNKK